MPVVVLVADGARFDAFSGDLTDFPALARMRAEGGLHKVTTVFPSVTGPAYIPFLLGRFPGNVGLPGIRWYDRARNTCSWPDYSRSYVGHQLRHVNSDLTTDSRTIFELAPHSVGALSVVTRGLTADRRYGTLTVRSALKVASTHFSGRAEDWSWMDEAVLETIPKRIRDDRPDYVFAALLGIDKASHADGHDSPRVREAMTYVDRTVARIRDDAERGGTWDDLHVWVVSDHGHSNVHTHEDLAGVIAATGARTIAHPWTYAIAPDVAVMVSGNAMAHVYVDVERTERAWWQALAARWSSLVEILIARDATDLVLLPRSNNSCEIRSRRGVALLTQSLTGFQYERTSGDPLQLGSDLSISQEESHSALLESDYPDAFVQIMHLAASARAGDIILSAAPGYDFRARYEPIPHVSAHGALHRDHMIVPLLTNRPPARTPERTTDVFASSLHALGIRSPTAIDGRSFLATHYKA